MVKFEDSNILWNISIVITKALYVNGQTIETLIVTGFAKTVPSGTRIEIPFIAWHES